MLVLVLVFMAGYATQRGTTCAVSAAQEIVLERRVTRLAGFFLCAFVSLGLMAVAHLFGLTQIQRFGESSSAGVAAFGGAIFGVGAYINGRCAFGTIAKLGSGEVARVGTLAGFFCGSFLAVRFQAGQPKADVSTALIAIDAPMMLILAVVAIAIIGRYVSANTPSTDFNAGWSTLRAMLVIGAVNGSLLLLMQGWSYTSLLMAFAEGQFAGLAWQKVIVIVLMVGAVAGAIVGKTFKLDLGNRRGWLKTLIGGALMGVGATLVPGGNDRMLMLGFPMLLPNLMLAYVAMMIVLVIIAGIERRYGERLA